MNPIVILRIGAGICFIGHGALALGGKVHFVELLGSFGFQETMALQLLKIIGLVDILIGIGLLLKPSKFVVLWATIWTSLTVLAWGFYGDSLMDLFRRVPYIAVPLALYGLLYRKSESTGKVVNTSSSIVHQEKGVAAIRSLNLSRIKMKMMNSEEGEGWSQRQCDEVAEEYRRYLQLNLLYPDETIVPNQAVDAMWHYHILDTEAYYKDCQNIFGHILHHYPYFGMGGGKTEQRAFVNSFDRTRELYEITFSTPMEGPDYLPSFQRVA